MPKPIQTAVAAAATPMVRMQICASLAENGVELMAMTRTALQAEELVAASRPELLIVDMELMQLDGVSLALRILQNRRLPVRPAVFLLYSAALCLPRRSELEALGAVLIPKPLDAARLHAALDHFRAAPPCFLPEEAARADALLSELGIPNHLGRDCLRLAMLMCARDEGLRRSMGNRLYPIIAAQMHISTAQAEQAMRHAISLAWQSYSNYENQYRIFGDTIDAERGMPTCWEMISHLADILRLEG